MKFDFTVDRINLNNCANNCENAMKFNFTVDIINLNNCAKFEKST